MDAPVPQIQFALQTTQAQQKPDHETFEPTAPKRPLPVARVRKIMKENRDSRFAEEAIIVMTAATELFIGKLAQLTCEQGTFKDPMTMEYTDVAKCVQSHARMQFLQEHVPTTIKVESLIAQAKDALRNGENSNEHRLPPNEIDQQAKTENSLQAAHFK